MPEGEGRKPPQVFRPEPTNRIPPGFVAFEEWGVLVSYGSPEDIFYPPAIRNRYLIGVHA